MKNLAGLLISLVWWAGIGWIIINHNVAFTNSSTLRWTNPTRASAHFSWQALPKIMNGEVVIIPGAANRFTATLPRGFVSGQLRVQFRTPATNGAVLLTADAQSSDQIGNTSTASPALLNIQWDQLSARDHSFTFSIQNNHNDTLYIESLLLQLERQ